MEWDSLMLMGEWRRWLQRIVSGQNKHSRPRRKHGSIAILASAEIVSAETLETRVLLSATSATHLVFTVQPTNRTAGQSFSVTVSVENSSDSVVATNDFTIRLTLRGPGSFAGDGRTMTATAVNGIANFNDLTLEKAGTYTLEASIGHRHQVSSNSFVVSPDTNGTQQLVFLRHDTQYGTVSEPLRTVAVAVEDQYGNIIKTDTSRVTLAVNSGPTTSFESSVPSPYTVSTVNGVAKFDNVILDSAGTYTLSATDSNSAVTKSVSDSITINAQGQNSRRQHHYDNGYNGDAGFGDRFYGYGDRHWF